MRKKRKRKEIKPCLGFRFTEIEEIRMKLHIANAIIFMEKYGKGQQPLRTGYPISRRNICTCAD